MFRKIERGKIISKIISKIRGLKRMESLGLKSRETFRKNYMHPALKLGLVEMTIPDKPNSRNQRYVKK